MSQALPLVMSPVPFQTPTASAVAARTAAEKDLQATPAGRKLLKAAREFEANLISSWWEEAEKDLQDPNGGELGSGFDALKNVAMNAMAQSMVAAGGLGISRMIFHSLEPALRRKMDHDSDSNPLIPSTLSNGAGRVQEAQD